ncbi:unnamed protein product [Effrenium voratum]|nr:unnamed protein product [Effrenium voratum]
MLSWLLWALQLLLLALQLALLRRSTAPPAPKPEPEPAEVEAPPDRKARPKKSKKAVVLRPLDRLPPPHPPVLRPLRDGDPRVDASAWLRLAPAKRSGTAVLVLPGGNYDSCNWRQPLEVASWLRDLGIVAYILRYRLRSEGHFWPAQLEDCELALEQMRAEAAREGFDPARSPALGQTKRPGRRALHSALRVARIGVLGFSAGGHLATVAATCLEPPPAFQILLYATTDVETPLWDPWKARLGYPGTDFNTVPKVSRRTAPVFAVVSTEDDVTSFKDNTWPYIEACKRHKVEAEYVHASMGPHGHGMLDVWTKPCERWLRAHGWANNSPHGGSRRKERSSGLRPLLLSALLFRVLGCLTDPEA